MGGEPGEGLAGASVAGDFGADGAEGDEPGFAQGAGHFLKGLAHAAFQFDLVVPGCRGCGQWHSARKAREVEGIQDSAWSHCRIRTHCLQSSSSVFPGSEVRTPRTARRVRSVARCRRAHGLWRILLVRRSRARLVSMRLLSGRGECVQRLAGPSAGYGENAKCVRIGVYPCAWLSYVSSCPCRHDMSARQSAASVSLAMRGMAARAMTNTWGFGDAC